MIYSNSDGTRVTMVNRGFSEAKNAPFMNNFNLSFSETKKGAAW
jgi:hypothetical protein